MKCYIARIAALLLLVSLLAGCVAPPPTVAEAPISLPPPPTVMPTPTPEPAPKPAQSEPVTLNLMSWFPSVPIGKGETALMEQFSQSHPDVIVKRGEMMTWEPYPFIRSEGAGGKKTPADLVSNPPDIFMRKSVERGELVDVTGLWEDAGLLESLPPAMPSFAAVDGKQYYMPYGLSWAAIYYNKAIFAQYQLMPPETWEEFLAICETLKQNGETPLVIPGQHWFPDGIWIDYLDMRMNGPAFHRQLQNGEIPFTDERVRAALETWQKLFLDGYVHPKSAGMGTAQALGALVRGDDGTQEADNAVMMLARSDQLLSLPQQYHAELDFFAFPMMDSAVARGEVIHVLGYLLPKKAAHTGAAMTFAESVVSIEFQQALVEAGVGLAPVNPEIDLAVLDSDIQQGRALLDQAEDLTVVFFLMPESMYFPAKSAVNSFLQEPQKLDLLIERLEKARQSALANGDFVQ